MEVNHEADIGGSATCTAMVAGLSNGEAASGALLELLGRVELAERCQQGIELIG